MSTTPAPQNSAPELKQLAQEFWKWRAMTQPFGPDDISRLERPGGERDWSAAAIARQKKELADFEELWRGMEPHRWAICDQVNYRLIGSALARVRWEMDVLQRWQRDPNFYLEQTLTALQEALTVPGPFDAGQSKEILARIENIPSILESGMQNLIRPARHFVALASARLDDIRERFLALAAALQPWTTLSPDRLQAAAERAASALEGFREWLRTVPALPENSAIGREAYLFFLSNVAQMPLTPEQLLAMAQQELERSISFEEIERNLNAALPALPIAANLQEQILRSVTAEAEIRNFLERENLLTVPASVAHYRVAPVPPYLKPLESFGESIDFTSPSRLDQNATRYLNPPSGNLGYFWLATAKDPRPDMVHEGIPGHYLQFAISWRHPDPIRRHFYDSGANEGIGFYAEEMMLQAGLFDDSPRSREIIYNFARLRALRVEVDIKLALGIFDIEQAAGYLERAVPMDRATARHEAAFFACTAGQAMAYQIGKIQVLKFLADARTCLGEDFRLREFHDSLWLNGNVPIALQRWEMLGLRDEIERMDANRDLII
jgi:uncharacterized protein (DUF885 family)